MRQLVCTIFENDFHYGAAALINSLCRNGFKGTFVGAFRGEFPPWAKDATPDGPDRRKFTPVEGVEVILERVAPEIHMARFKPFLLVDLLDRYKPDFIHFFDADIVVKWKWERFETWASEGVAICEDIISHWSRFHPQKLGWAKWIAQKGYKLHHPLDDNYFNSGYIGSPASQRAFVDKWKEILEQILLEIKDDFQYSRPQDPTYAFYLPDQAAFNIATYLGDFPLRVFPSCMMDFAPTGYMMSHAIGPHKPWNCDFLEFARKRRPISTAVAKFFSYIDYPIRVFPTLKRRWIKSTFKYAWAKQQKRMGAVFVPPLLD